MPRESDAIKAWKGWVIAESVDGTNIEYWAAGSCVLSIPCDSEDAEAFDRVKKLLTYLKAEPTEKKG